ncbi:oxygenase MpaB family protein [Nocardia sp. NPDC058518]|uniref:oxygenase MpaB family protein n=1 Tax=Nocardia sp. NPDC058518 TaxID=3346534 RepID=UPI00365F4AFC
MATNHTQRATPPCGHIASRVVEQQFHLEVPTTRVDDGLFGPGSVSWKVWSHPAVIPGVMRSFVLDMVASPHGAAALEEHSRYREDPLGRLNRTMHYFLTVVFADTDTVAKANRRLDRLHARIVGTEPMTGGRYSALDPYLQLGNHMLSWHSVYYAYQTLVGGLTPEDTDRFFREAAIAFETLGVDEDALRASAAEHGIDTAALGDRIPAGHEEYRELWAASRHLICVNAQTRGALEAILHPRALDGSLTKATLFQAYPALARVGLALIPRHVRATCGLPTSATADAVALRAGRATAALLHRTGAYPQVLQRLSPHGYQIQVAALGHPRR